MSICATKFIERDLRQIQNITDLSLFQKFIKLCAGRVGQILNLSSLAIDCGVSHVTIRRWFSILEASYVVYLLKPFYSNFNKRIIKSPKIYFYDTGLACYLLNIKSSDQLQTHFAKGALFENYILSEMLKYYFNKGKRPDVYYLRNKTGQEIDFVYSRNNQMSLMEIKSNDTISTSFFANLQYWQEFIKGSSAYLVFTGTSNATSIYKNIAILNWKEFYKAL